MASPSVKPPHPVRNFRLRPTHYCYDTSSVETKPMKATCLSGLCIQRGWERWRSSNPFSSPILSSFLLSPTQSNHFPQRFSRQVVQLPLFVIEGQGARISSKARYGFALQWLISWGMQHLTLLIDPSKHLPFLLVLHYWHSRVCHRTRFWIYCTCIQPSEKWHVRALFMDHKNIYVWTESSEEEEEEEVYV